MAKYISFLSAIINLKSVNSKSTDLNSDSSWDSRRREENCEANNREKWKRKKIEVICYAYQLVFVMHRSYRKLIWDSIWRCRNSNCSIVGCRWPCGGHCCCWPTTGAGTSLCVSLLVLNIESCRRWIRVKFKFIRDFGYRLKYNIADSLFLLQPTQ